MQWKARWNTEETIQRKDATIRGYVNQIEKLEKKLLEQNIANNKLQSVINDLNQRLTRSDIAARK